MEVFSVLVVARCCYGSSGPNRCSYDLGVECTAQCVIAPNLIEPSRAVVADRYAASRYEA